VQTQTNGANWTSASSQGRVSAVKNMSSTLVVVGIAEHPKSIHVYDTFIIQSFAMVEKALGIRLHGSKQVERAYCRRLNAFT